MNKEDPFILSSKKKKKVLEDVKEAATSKQVLCLSHSAYRSSLRQNAVDFKNLPGFRKRKRKEEKRTSHFYHINATWKTQFP